MVVGWLRRGDAQEETADDRTNERKVWKPVGLLAQLIVWYWCFWGCLLSLLLTSECSQVLQLLQQFGRHPIIDWLPP